MTPYVFALGRTLTPYVVVLVLWGTDLAWGYPTYSDGKPDVEIASHQVGSAVEVRLSNMPEGEVRVEVEVQGPRNGSTRSLGTLSGTPNAGGGLTLVGPVLSEDERWRHIRVRVISGDKVIARDIDMVD